MTFLKVTFHVHPDAISKFSIAHPAPFTIKQEDRKQGGPEAAPLFIALLKFFFLKSIFAIVSKFHCILFISFYIPSRKKNYLFK